MSVESHARQARERADRARFWARFSGWCAAVAVGACMAEVALFLARAVN